MRLVLGPTRLSLLLEVMSVHERVEPATGAVSGAPAPSLSNLDRIVTMWGNGYAFFFATSLTFRKSKHKRYVASDLVVLILVPDPPSTRLSLHRHYHA